MEEIEYKDFAKIDFRVGKIVEAIEVEGSDKLIKMKVYFGDLGEKQVFSGIKKWYKAEDLIGKKSVFVVNMPPKKVMGEISEAMIFAGEDEKGKISLIVLDKELACGSQVY